jgi:RNA polymerase sigma-70 factor (ECF subfamily)
MAGNVEELPAGTFDAGSPRQKPGDDDLVERVKRGDLTAFELLMRRHNQRLYRAIRSILRTGAEVEDAMQDTYLSAFKHLDQFEGRAQFGTWLLKIGIHEALARVKRPAVVVVALDDLPEGKGSIMERRETDRTPEQQASNHEMIALVEAALDRLPDDYRQVFMLRLVDSLDTAETADVLGLTETAVRQRLHRAREMLQGDVEAQVGSVVQSAFGFLGPRCDRIVANVMGRLSASIE